MTISQIKVLQIKVLSLKPNRLKPLPLFGIKIINFLTPVVGK